MEEQGTKEEPNSIDQYKLVENIYADTREWLKFTEAKNAALLALTSATIFGFIRIISNQSFNKYVIIFIFLMLLITLSIALVSFRPRKVNNYTSNKIDKSNNLLFYNNLSKSNPKKIYDLFNEKYFLNDSTNSVKDEYISDLCIQIHALSSITVSKNKNFKAGILFMALSYILMLLLIGFSLF